jgi:hypothetical protein
MKTSTKRTSIALLIIIAFVLLSFGWTYYFQNREMPKNAKSLTTIDQVSGMKMYTDRELGLSLSYPAVWSDPKAVMPEGGVRGIAIGDKLAVSSGIHKNSAGKVMNINDVVNISNGPITAVTVGGEAGISQYSAKTGTIINVELDSNKIFTLEYMGKSDDAVLKQIISSVKFTK